MPIRPAFSRILPLAASLSLLALAPACGDLTGSERDPLSRGVGSGLERLHSDAELHTPEDPAAPAENADWARWVERNHEPVRSLTSHNFADLRFLEPLLAGKRIVQLGESSHGVAEYSTAKVRLIKYLHEEQGFDVLAVEGGLYECWLADRNVGTQPAVAVLRNCMYGVWAVKEVLPLFEYLEETRRTGRPLRLAGFDVQPSGNATSGRAAFFRDLVRVVDPVYADSVTQVDVTFRFRISAEESERRAYLEASGDRLAAHYRELAAFFARHREAIAAAFPDRPEAARVAQQVAASIPVYIDELRQPNADASIPVRDRGMAENFEFLLQERFPGEKVMVWAHNFHIRHRNLEVSPSEKFALGTAVAERHRAELYTIGLYAYRGRMRSNAGLRYDVFPMPAGSLESILYRTRRKFAFVDLHGAPREAGTAWMDQPILTHSSGANPERMVVRDQYDGILFIDTVTIPFPLSGF
ncbi:MAG TPA: erythromycin esterase family protein [Longimicrobiaceae bacterium]|nr:erythromycin esterase family protein [Longimicrobiaceae bacterium]